MNDKQNGQGKEIWLDGSSYEGQYVDGYKHGSGVLTFSDRAQYSGEFEANMINGYGSGKMSWPDGRSYEGEFVNDVKHGIGIYIWGEKKYYGYWKEGRQHGLGIYKSNKLGKIFGIWKNGKRETIINKEQFIMINERLDVDFI